MRCRLGRAAAKVVGHHHPRTMQVDFIPFGEEGFSDWRFNLLGLTAQELGLIDVALGGYKAPEGKPTEIEYDMWALKSLIKDQSNQQIRAFDKRLSDARKAG